MPTRIFNHVRTFSAFHEKYRPVIPFGDLRWSSGVFGFIWGLVRRWKVRCVISMLSRVGRLCKIFVICEHTCCVIKKNFIYLRFFISNSVVVYKTFIKIYYYVYGKRSILTLGSPLRTLCGICGIQREACDV